MLLKWFPIPLLPFLSLVTLLLLRKSYQLTHLHFFLQDVSSKPRERAEQRLPPVFCHKPPAPGCSCIQKGYIRSCLVIFHTTLHAKWAMDRRKRDIAGVTSWTWRLSPSLTLCQIKPSIWQQSVSELALFGKLAAGRTVGIVTDEGGLGSIAQEGSISENGNLTIGKSSYSPRRPSKTISGQTAASASPCALFCSYSRYLIQYSCLEASCRSKRWDRNRIDKYIKTYIFISHVSEVHNAEVHFECAIALLLSTTWTVSLSIIHPNWGMQGNPSVFLLLYS